MEIRNDRNGTIPDYLSEVRRTAAREAAMATYAPPEIPEVFLLDGSGSMNYFFDGIRSRWDVLVDNTLYAIRRVRQNEDLAHAVSITIVIFNSQEEVICENVLAADVDLEKLEQQLRAYRPHGVTAMGKAIVNALARIDARKRTLQEAKRDYYQGIMVITSDGIPTNSEGKYSMESMSQAICEVDKRIAENKLTVLPVGLGDADSKPEDFAVLARLVSKDAEGGIPVLMNAQDVRKYFRFIGQTVQAVSKDMRDVARKTLGYTPGKLA